MLSQFVSGLQSLARSPVGLCRVPRQLGCLVYKMWPVLWYPYTDGQLKKYGWDIATIPNLFTKRFLDANWQ